MAIGLALHLIVGSARLMWKLSWSSRVAVAMGAALGGWPVWALAGEPEDLGELPYLYLRKGSGKPMTLTAEYEAALGSRQSRFFGQDGVEQGARLRLQPWSFINLEGGGAVVLDEHGYQGETAGGEVNVRALNQQDHYINIHLGGGYYYDYTGTHVPRLRWVLGRELGRFDINTNGLIEMPVAKDRDEADIMLGVVGSYLVTAWYRQGLEIQTEDLEGLWEEEEAEGGAKLLIGPTNSLLFTDSLQLKMSAAAVLAMTQNTPTVGTGQAAPRVGFMGRLVLGYTFDLAPTGEAETSF